MRKSTFQKHIDQLSEEELKAELSLLYDKIEAVKKFYKMELGSVKDKKKYYDAAKKLITSKFATKSFRKPRRPRIQKVNSILRELKDRAIFEFEMIDIYLFTAETAISFMRDYYFQSDPVFNITTNCFSKACVLIKENRMESEYLERCDQIIERSRYYIGMNKELKKAYLEIMA